MRTLTSAAQTKLATQYGTEPLVIIEIQWVENGNRLAYADRKIVIDGETVVHGQIIELGSIDAAVKVDGTSDSTQVQLTLEDTDGAIKAICDISDLNKRPVWVYQWFEGLDLDDKFLLFKGEINSPFTWNEGDRTVTFDVTTRIEDVEAGFSMEEGDFPLIPPDALGKPWPLAFGSVCDIEAVQVRAPRAGILASGEGIHDYTLESRICQARYIQCASVLLGTSQQITDDSVFESPTVENDYGSGPDGLIEVQAETVDNWGPDQGCVEDRFYAICDLMHQLEQQRAYEHESMTILDGYRLFPQNETITLNIEGGKFTGHFPNSNTFIIEGREHPDYSLNPPSRCAPVADRSYTLTGVLDQTDWVQTPSGTAWYDGSVYNGSSGGTDIDPQEVEDFCDTSIQTDTGWATDGGPAASQKAFDDMVTSSFFWARAGSKVYMEAEAEVLYVVSLIPCTITRVAAIKTVRGIDRLVTVPADHYTIYETDYDGYTVTEIGMTKPLSERTELVTNPDGTKRTVSSNWSDNLYVSVTSTVGPNAVDIIEWLLAKYTSLTPDATSFAYVKDRLTNYPCNFALIERKNVMQLIADIAIQSRCVVYVRDDTMYLKYFSEEPTSAATIAESDILANTLQVTLSSTDEIVTKHTVNWSRSQSEGPLTLILKHNVAKYGTHQKDIDYYTQNVYDQILKSATFWMIRDANVWKIVEFTTPLKHSDLEVFDCVTLNLTDVAPAPVKAVITAIKYDVGAQEIAFTCWTPLKAGQTTPYIHAWPADIPAGTIFPTAEEREAGLGYDFTVTPPEGHLLYVEPEDNGQPKVSLTSGDQYPSDLNDGIGTCFCPTTDDAVVDEPDPVFDALKRAQRANQSEQDTKASAPDTAGSSGGGSDKHDKKKGKCDCEPGPVDGCNCIVAVMYCTADLCQSNWAPCTCTGFCYQGQCGGVCTGALFTWCYTMGSSGAAASMRTKINVSVMAHQCDWTTGVTRPYLTPSVTCCGGCDPLPGQTPYEGQTKQPALQS
jgi:hypothetical protein